VDNNDLPIHDHLNSSILFSAIPATHDQRTDDFRQFIDRKDDGWMERIRTRNVSQPANNRCIVHACWSCVVVVSGCSVLLLQLVTTHSNV